MNPAKALAVLLLELALVAAGVRLGAEMAQAVSIIPGWLIHLPLVVFGPADLRIVVLSFVAATALSFLGLRLFAGWDPFATPRRFAAEVYALVAGVVAAAMYQFLLTNINFSPELLLDASLFSFILLLAAYAVVRSLRGDPLLQAVFAPIGKLFALLRSPWAWVVLAFATTPIIAGRMFTTDRDFANAVTRLRVAANSSRDLPYALVNGLGTTNFLTPIMVQFAPNDPATIYVLERNGGFYRADYPSGAGKRLLVDLSAKLGYVEMENGALGFDLHPEFGQAGSPSRGFVYIYYTAYAKDKQTNYLTRFDLSVADPAASRLDLIVQERGNDGYHNGGSVEFGPDGFLYLAVGEASAEACHQRIDCNLYGGILRIDVDNRGGAVSRPIAQQPQRGRTAHYSIPSDNPFVEQAGALAEFYALGLRNPFRISFDSATGALWAGEVGSTEWEEVNRIVRGGNYQYPYIEGRTVQQGKPRPQPLVGREQTPVYTYKHTALLRSVIGGIVYRGSVYPDLDGKYLFLDNYSGELMTLPADAQMVDQVDIVARTPDVAQRGPTAVVQAPDGAVLVPVMGDNDKPTGIVARLVPKGDARAVALADTAKAPRVAALVTAEQERSLYNVNCARCHGAGGLGDGPDSAELGAHVPNFTDARFHKWRSDAELHAAIAEGGEAVGASAMMPPWTGVLRPEEIDAMVRYVRGFNGKAAAN